MGLALQSLWHHSRLPASIAGGRCCLQELQERRTGLDATQQDALTHALTQRVSLVQGPPGTGAVQAWDMLY